MSNSMRYLCLALAAALLFTACSKNSVVTPGREDILRSGNWKLSSGTMMVKLPDGKHDTTLNYMDYVDDCYKDDYLVFDSLGYGRRFLGPNKCTPANPDYVAFRWQLTNNDNSLDLYDGLNNLFWATDTVQPYHFDTLQQYPFLVLDTIHGYLDTLPGYTRTLIVLDTIRELRFSSVHVGDPNAGIASGAYDIHKAIISNFSSSSFTISFTMLSVYPDTTGTHTADIGNPPRMLQDTVKYKLTYSK